ncbi:MAG TPA: response regulator [Actinomycetota bacterium]|nr:response regulator [Actinomycetota bacterium]
MSKTILIVEDEAALRELEKVILESQGYQVMEAKDGLEGLAKAEFQRPDLILLDLMMPDVSGRRMFDEMRSHKATAGIPIIVVTGRPDAHETFDHEIGAANVILKPFESDQLIERIREHIGDPD